MNNTSLPIQHYSFDIVFVPSRTRLLRANLLQPLKDIQTINARLDCLVSVTVVSMCPLVGKPFDSLYSFHFLHNFTS